jgi:hypothetical protein
MFGCSLQSSDVGAMVSVPGGPFELCKGERLLAAFDAIHSLPRV